MSTDNTAVIDYTNWRGERRTRRIRPHMLVFKESQWHPGKQWIVEAWDLDAKLVDIKDFAMSGIHSWAKGGEEGGEGSGEPYDEGRWYSAQEHRRENT